MNSRNLRRNRRFKGSFRVGVSEATDYFSTQQYPTYLAKTGLETHVSVTPIQFDTTSGFRSLPVATRNCTFPDEVDQGNAQLFATGSQKKCIFECSLDAGMELAANCIPWNMPRLDKWTAPICDGKQASIYV